MFIGEEEEEAAAEIDPYELMESVDILPKIPKDFYEKIVSNLNSNISYPMIRD